MADDSPERLAWLADQVRWQLEGWHAAGVEWISRVEGEMPMDVQRSLFAPEPEPEVAPLDPEARRVSLEMTRQEVAVCVRCPELSSTRNQTVFGVGPIDAELMLIGEAPGAEEDRRGEPFVGQAGQMLDNILKASGLSREEIFITNVLRCRPPNNRPPTEGEAANCSEWLNRTIELVRPKFILVLGGSAAVRMIGKTISITKARGKFYDYNGVPFLCTYHPASLLPGRSPGYKKDVWQDMKTLLEKMGRPVPGRS